MHVIEFDRSKIAAADAGIRVEKKVIRIEDEWKYIMTDEFNAVPPNNTLLEPPPIAQEFTPYPIAHESQNRWIGE